MSHFDKNWNHSKVDARREKKFRIVEGQAYYQALSRGIAEYTV